MAKVFAVNNYPTAERFVRLRRCLESNGAEVDVGDRLGCSAARFRLYDGVVLSGAPDMLSTPRARSKFSKEIESVRETGTPTLGICFGHQLMALAFGARVVEDSSPVLGFVRTEFLNADPIFLGLPRSTMLLESRHEVVKSLPDGFALIARSAESPIAAMKHTKRPLYGVQFHPERYSRGHPAGNRIIANFVGMLT